MTSPRSVLVALGSAIAAAATVSVVVASAVPAASTTASRQTGPSKRGTAKAQVLTVGVAGGVSAIDPHTSATAAEDIVLSLMYNGLTKLNTKGSISPDLATSWTASKDAKTWTFKLRAATFSNGDPLTSAVVKANVERMLDPKIASQAASRLKDINGILTPDPHTIVFTLLKSNAVLPAAFASPYEGMLDPSTFATATNGGIGTGPYLVSQFVPNDHVTLTPNPHYFGHPPKIATITQVNEPDITSAQAAFRAGSIDVLYGIGPSDVVSLTGATGAYALQPAAPSGLSAWEVDNTTPPFNKLQARQALYYAIDRKTMAQVAYSGIGVAAQASSTVSPANPYYNKALTPYPFNLNKAQRLFAAAGVKKGSTLTFWSLSGAYPEWITMAEILKIDLAKIHIKLVIRSNDLNTWLGKFLPATQALSGRHHR